MPLKAPELFERNGRFYLVGKIAPVQPAAKTVEEYAFGTGVVADMQSQSPNENLSWFQGHYVEADMANKNGALWGGGELAIKSLTPRMMPVTVMHDPSTAVGLIADTRLYTPEKDKVERAKIDTVLALWKHRFPQVHEEAMHNFDQGTLMQSMECTSFEYSCTECGQVHHKLPEDAERAHWCAHLESGKAARQLHDFTFTGTGLIFGSRGAEGADPSANLTAFADEVAYLHERARHDASRKTPPKRRKNTMEIDDKKYEELVAKAAEADRLKSVGDDLASVKETLRETEGKITALEAEKVTLETAKNDLAAKVTAFEEKAAAGTLREDRLGKLGSGFVGKLGDATKARLADRASKLSDDEWEEEIAFTEEILGVKRDASDDSGSSDDDDDTAAADKGKGAVDETASFQGGKSSGPAKNPTAPAQRQRGYAGLL